VKDFEPAAAEANADNKGAEEKETKNDEARLF